MTAPRRAGKPSSERAAIGKTSAIPGGPAGERQVTPDSHIGAALRPQDLLLLASEELDNIESSRIAISNQMRALITPKVVGKKGGHFGKGLPKKHPVPELMRGVVEALEDLEAEAIKKLEKAMRGHPLYPWAKRTVGVGAKQAGRLLAVIGDPGARKTVSQLWAYCGHHVVDGQAPRRKAGRKSNWNPAARMRVHLIAEAAMKAGVRKDGEPDDDEGYDIAQRKAITPLGKVYMDARAKYAAAVHGSPCARCGPPENPAPVGSPLSNVHKHARALRLVAKEILKQLWIEARRVHGGSEAQRRNDSPSPDPLSSTAATGQSESIARTRPSTLSEESAAMECATPMIGPRRSPPISPTDARARPQPITHAHPSDLSESAARRLASPTSTRRSLVSAETNAYTGPTTSSSRPPSKTAARRAILLSAPMTVAPVGPRSPSKAAARPAKSLPMPTGSAPGAPPPASRRRSGGSR